MAKSRKQQDDDEVILDIGGAYNKTERFVEENQKPILTAVGAVVAIVALYFAYQFLYLRPLEKEAAEEMWRAEQYFEADSFNLALMGDGNYLGFIDIADEYSATKSGNLANYYIGLIYLKTGEYEAAIDYLSDFSSEDIMLNSVSKGALGDAYMELGEVDNALSNYEAAANASKNDFTTPIYLMKAAKIYESVGDFDEALALYKQVGSDYPDTEEGRNVEKYIARAEAMIN
jgi:tetratricopeptide (TPR) repeat protein